MRLSNSSVPISFQIIATTLDVRLVTSIRFSSYKHFEFILWTNLSCTITYIFTISVILVIIFLLIIIVTIVTIITITVIITLIIIILFTIIIIIVVIITIIIIVTIICSSSSLNSEYTSLQSDIFLLLQSF